jgi:Calx-beta domain
MKAAAFNPFDGPTDFIRQIPLKTNDLVYSALTGKLYASIPGSAGSGGNSIAAIDPTTGVVGTPTFVGSEPNKLALSDDGHNLYVSLDGSLAIRRFDTLTNTPGLQFSLGQDSFFGRYSVSDFAVAPGNPDLLAVARIYLGVSPPEAGVAVFDNGVRRTNVGPGHISGSDFLAFSASASKLYGTGQSSGLTTMAIDASGVTVSFAGTLASGARIKFSNGKIFSSLGHIINPDSNTLLGTFTGVNTRAFVPDTTAGRAYYLTTGPSSGTLSLKAFDINTFLSVGSLTIPGVSGLPTSLVRWGANGLAFRTDNNQLFIIQTSLIPSAEPIPTPTPIPSPLPSPSPSPAAATFVRQIALSTNDLVYSQATQKFYASVPSSVGSSGNSVAELDPVLGSISNQTFVGSEPTQLALADDGQTLYVGLDGAAAIRSYNIISHAPGDQFSVGRDNFTGPYTFSDIAVSPGNPSVVAVARQNRFNSPSEAGVAIFDGGVQRTNTGPGHISGSDFMTFGGELSKNVSVPIINDNLYEGGNETFRLTLNVSSVSIANAIITIANDDATVQVSSPALSVNEGAGFATVIVTRLGDISKAATVHFATTDVAGLQNCTLSNGKASERCDYATTVGLLQFGFGQITRALIIPIVDDALVEGDETFTINLSGAVGATVGTPNPSTITIVDNDTTPATQNPVDGVTPFITQQYIDFLGRLPDTIGLANWTATLGNCPNNGLGEFDNPDCDRVHVSAGFFLSEEFRGRGYFAYKFYEVGLDRRPTYVEFVPDMAEVGGAQSPESEVISKAAYTDAFVQRQEFKNRYDAMSNTDYVNTLETNAEVTLGNKAALIDALNQNQKTRAQVLREIVELQSVSDKFFIRAFVAMQYFGYLRRDPDTIGYANWVTTLTADPNNFRHMIFGFVYSDEYRHRFGP